MAEKSAKNNKVKPEWINNRNCLNNLVATVNKDTKVVVFGDNLNKDTVEFIDSLPVDYRQTKSHGNSETFLEALSYALTELEDDDIVYFVEDDYIHAPGFVTVLKEGFVKGDYVTLYDHPDRYSNMEATYVFHTDNAHWRYVSSTTMTFAAKVSTLVYDEEVFTQMVTTGNPPDFHIFQALTQTFKRKLVSPIPGYATHGESAFLAPVRDWEVITQSNWEYFKGKGSFIA